MVRKAAKKVFSGQATRALVELSTILRMVPTIPLYTHFVEQFSVLMVLGLKKALKFDFFKKIKTKIFILNIFPKKKFRNELHTHFLPYFDT